MIRIHPAFLVLGLWLAAAPAAAALSGPQQRSPGGLPAPPDPIKHLLEQISTVIELIGIAAIVVGGIVSTFVVLKSWAALGSTEARYHHYRSNLGRSILLGLEFLVAADIIGTVAAVPTFESLGILAIVILLRTFLSFSLETEIQGRFPWRDAAQERAKEEARAPG